MVVLRYHSCCGGRERGLAAQGEHAEDAQTDLVSRGAVQHLSSREQEGKGVSITFCSPPGVMNSSIKRKPEEYQVNLRPRARQTLPLPIASLGFGPEAKESQHQPRTHRERGRCVSQIH